tara:strand:- start:63 stop:254 length:192 start_codon:yes stop_codon:yes gene_type:complete
MSSLQKIINKTHRLKKPFANLEAGSPIYCFAHTETHYWILLPETWHGVQQVKIKRDLLLDLIE